MNEINTNEIKEIIKEITLNTLNTISQPLNYKILKTLPANISQISEVTELHDTIIETRLKRMEKQYLVEYHKDNWCPTKVTIHILELIGLLLESAEMEANTLLYKTKNKEEKQ